MQTIGPIEALGTHWYLRVYDDGADGEKISVHTKALLEDFEERFSRFRQHSWLSRLNTNRVFSNPDSEFVAILEASLEYHELTDGVFNIAVGEKMEKSGYDQNYSFTGVAELPTVPALTNVLNVSSGKLEMSGPAKLDLGGIGKGWAIDKLTRSFKEALGLRHFLINGGGDIFATSNHGEPIEVKLAHPTEPKQYIGSVHIQDQGFASSSPHLRTWKDRKTGEERNHLHTTAGVSAYVVADSATEADVFATTLAIAPATNAPKEIKFMLVQGSRVLSKDQSFELLG